MALSTSPITTGDIVHYYWPSLEEVAAALRPDPPEYRPDDEARARYAAAMDRSEKGGHDDL